MGKCPALVAGHFMVRPSEHTYLDVMGQDDLKIITTGLVMNVRDNVLKNGHLKPPEHLVIITQDVGRSHPVLDGAIEMFHQSMALLHFIWILFSKASAAPNRYSLGIPAHPEKSTV